MRLSKLCMKAGSILLLASFVLNGCAAAGPSAEKGGGLGRGGSGEPVQGVAAGPGQETREGTRAEGLAFDYEVEPEAFSIEMTVDGQSLPAAAGGAVRKLAEFSEDGDETSWSYPGEAVRVSVKPDQDYLAVEITSETESDHEFVWPDVSADSYYIPLGEGKRVVSGVQEWKDYLRGREFGINEALSMPFWASVYGDYAVLYIMENPYRASMVFSSERTAFSVRQEYPAIAGEKTSRYRIYVTENDPVAISKIYRSYVKEQGRFVTLEEKAEQNPDVRKLYGAPHIYLHGDLAVSPEDIAWPAFREAVDTPVMQHIKSFFDKVENGAEARTVFSEIGEQDYVAEYQKNTICAYLSALLKRNDFYVPEIFTRTSPEMEGFAKDGYQNLAPYQQIRINQWALGTNLPEVFKTVDNWLSRETTDILESMNEAGIKEAWIGLNSWEQAYIKPELVQLAADQGYLIGAYDSYHSIHEPGKEKWITAKFSDQSLYENATVTGADGEKKKGFKNVGRKLNPALSMPAVQSRMEAIMGADLPFNAWFIDCDATGEIYDDYSPAHPTTQEEDLAARLERMAYIRDTYGLVIGSEGGNDFAASTLAFAHGIEMKSFSWMDEDMNKNRDSVYYIGKYYNPKGGVAEHFTRRVPLKELYYTVFADPRYDVPLYKLVYNDSVITSYHWDWSTFKIQGATADRMVREVLYNVPPLYHLDGDEWEKYGDDIASHHLVWSEFSKKAVVQEMTGFEYLSGDCSVQRTEYGPSIAAIANFSDSPWQYQGQQIPAHAVLIQTEEGNLVYAPVVQEGNR